MEAGELKILEVDLAVQVRQIEAVYFRIEERAKIDNLIGTESVTYQLHNLYSAFKDARRL